MREPSPEPIVSYSAMFNANGLLLRALLGMLVRKKVITLDELDAIYSDAIRRGQEGIDEAQEDFGSAPLSVTEETVAFLALLRGQLRQARQKPRSSNSKPD